MSWKGFQKGIVRAPQNLKNKLGVNHEAKDPVIVDAEERFASMEALTKKLHTESKRYWESIRDMLAHQNDFLNSIERLYSPITGRPGGDADDGDGHVEALAACKQYREQIQAIQELIRPEHEMIETKILRPVDELLVLIRKAQKMFTKREHKLLDLERQTEALHKLQDKSERNPKQEEKMFKVENDYEMAKEQFSYYDELIKNELPKLFKLEGEVIEPMFQSFYFMQLNIYYTMHTRMADAKIAYFDMETDIVAAYRQKQGTVREQVEAIPIVCFNSEGSFGGRQKHDEWDGLGDGDYPGPRAGPRSNRSSYDRVERARTSAEPEPVRPVPPARFPDEKEAPPTYNESVDDAPKPPRRPAAARPDAPAVSKAVEAGVVDSGPPPPPPRRVEGGPPPPPVRPSTCVALYDYAAQNSNELSLRKGDVVRVVDQGHSKDDWWLGELNGVEGYFPGSFVELN